MKKQLKYGISSYWANWGGKDTDGSTKRTLASFELSIERAGIGHVRQLLDASRPIFINLTTHLCGKDQWLHLWMSENFWNPCLQEAYNFFRHICFFIVYSITVSQFFPPFSPSAQPTLLSHNLLSIVDFYHTAFQQNFLWWRKWSKSVLSHMEPMSYMRVLSHWNGASAGKRTKCFILFHCN